MTRRARSFLLIVTLLGAAPAAAQGGGRTAGVDSVVAPTVRALRGELSRLLRAERDLMPTSGESTLRPADDLVLERRDDARARVIAALDTLLAAGDPGRRAIRTLAGEWPGAELVRRAEVRAAFRAGDAADALRTIEGLAVAAPRDTQLLRWRAQALGSVGRSAEALRALQARFELAPEDEANWRSVLAAHEAAGSLAQLRTSLGRLRLLYPDSRAVREHEIEILHRLGRLDEAARLTADSTWRRP